jgi:hypothetical protein
MMLDQARIRKPIPNIETLLMPTFSAPEADPYPYTHLPERAQTPRSAGTSHILHHLCPRSRHRIRASLLTLSCVDLPSARLFFLPLVSFLTDSQSHGCDTIPVAHVNVLCKLERRVMPVHTQDYGSQNIFSEARRLTCTLT